jgi:cysteine desulfurase
MHRIYLDANASCPPIPEALDKIGLTMALWGNPSSFHEHGRALRAYLDQARLNCAQALNAQAKELVFTSGASEANRLFIDALVHKAQKNTRALKVIISPFEHPSLLKPALLAQELGYFDLKIMDVDKNGMLFWEKSNLSSCDVLICCQAHNETGIIPNLAQLLLEVSDQAIVMCDVAQGFARLSPVPSRIDAMTFSAQKMGALAGAGGLVLRGLAKSLSAPWAGGGQEGGFRPGTEASLLIIAMGEAALYSNRQRQANQETKVLRDMLESALIASGKAYIVGEHQERLPNTSALCFFGHPDPDALRIACDMQALSVGFGAACSGLAPVGSFALNRMGLSMHEQKRCVRFSLAPHLSLEDINSAISRMREIF